MTTRLVGVVIDANDMPSLARFWADALGWQLFDDHPDEIGVSPTPDRAFELVFEPVPEKKVAKNRVHLDLGPGDETQGEMVRRLLSIGAKHADIGQVDVPWVVLADPEGNEFCVTETKQTSPLAGLCIDSADPASMSAFWSAATGWPIEAEGDWGAGLKSPDGIFLSTGPPVAPKHGKNRLHFDVAPYPGDDQLAEVERLISLGATRIDIGQGDVPWVVLADPEGNEFCVLTPR